MKARCVDQLATGWQRGFDAAGSDLPLSDQDFGLLFRGRLHGESSTQCRDRPVRSLDDKLLPEDAFQKTLRHGFDVDLAVVDAHPPRRFDPGERILIDEEDRAVRQSDSPPFAGSRLNDVSDFDSLHGSRLDSLRLERRREEILWKNRDLCDIPVSRETVCRSNRLDSG